MLIRPARAETDIAAVAAIVNAFERLPVTLEQVRGWFDYRAPGRVALRFVSEDERAAITGYGCVIHEASALEREFYTWVGVAPEHRRRGAGAALWDAALERLRAHGAVRLNSEVLDNDPVSLDFAARRGLRIRRQLFHSALDLEGFDETPYLPALAALEAGGLRFCALADFPDTPETRRKLFDLNLASAMDIPGAERAPWSFEEFEKFVLGAPWFRREGQLLAVDGDTWAGMAAVSVDAQSGSAYNLHTGVVRAYRGRKIAQSLKVLAGRYARRCGMRRITTDNDSDNAPILAINRKMGYQPEPGKYLLEGELRETCRRFREQIRPAPRR